VNKLCVNVKYGFWPIINTLGNPWKGLEKKPAENLIGGERITAIQELEKNNIRGKK
jgi:hypothetical protein